LRRGFRASTASPTLISKTEHRCGKSWPPRRTGANADAVLAFVGVPLRDTLLLDQGYQPLAVIPWQRALVMQLVGKVELVSPHDWHVHTVTRSFPAPGVVRLLRRILHRPPLVRFSRENVYLRDEYCCQYCGVQYSPRELTLDHVLPRSRGGTTSWRNVVAA